MVGNRGSIQYLENFGTETAPAYIERTGAANPFASMSVDTASPAVADLDGDGDLDLVIGDRFTALRYFENTGDVSSALFIERTGSANPFDGIGGRDLRPSLIDIDEDGDLDAVIGLGGGGGNLRYLENTGTSLAPVFVERTGGANPFNGIDVGNASDPTFIDLDQDGDADLIVGERDGNLNYFENVTGTSGPSFALANLEYVAVGLAKDPAVADLDGDGDLDVVMGNRDGNFQYFLNMGTDGEPSLVEQTGAANPFNAVSVGEEVRQSLPISTVMALLMPSQARGMEPCAIT